jgi:hypothetical protein
MAMSSSVLKTTLLKSGVAACVLLLASGVAMAQSVVTLTATPTSIVLPDGQTVPMWGYVCGASSGTGVTCTAPNGTAQVSGTWQPPLITVPSSQSLTITLNNALSFTAGSATNSIPTSLVIVGQLGGGLGQAPVRMPSPTHAPQGTTWPGTPGTTNAGDPVFTPPLQADRVRSFATEVPAGGNAALVWSAVNLRPGTYLIQSGTQPSIQGPMGLYGVLVVTDASYPGQAFDKDLALLLSEIDPVQNASIDQAVRTAGFSDALVWSGQTGQCGDPTVHTCYPPAVNYAPRYFLINGTSFDRANAAAGALTVPAAATQGRVLLRFVNAGLRMHVPSVVGANMTLLAEDGNKLPGVVGSRRQSELFLPAGKTYDVTIQPRQSVAGTYAAATYAVFDRQLSLSTNNQQDGGMQTYVQVAGGAPTSTTAQANADSYFVVGSNTLTVDDPARGLIANDIGIYGVAVSGAAPAGLSLNANGTFTYTGLPTSFSYCGNGTTSGTACANVTLAACTGACLGGAPTAVGDSYSSAISTRLQIAPPGVLVNDSDPGDLPITALFVSNTCASVNLRPDGSFTATAAAGSSCSFTYRAVNSHNIQSASAATVSLAFPSATNLVVTLKNGKTGATLPNDYRWIIEEDRTTWINPTIESGGAPVRNAAINFHTSHTPVVAQGCVGAVSCETGQTLLGQSAVCDVGNGTCRTGAAQKVAVSPSQVHLDPTKRYYISILPGDGANPILDSATVGADGVGHTMSGAQIAPGQTAVTVFLEETPLEPAKIAVFVFQDDAPLNGEVDTGGGVDVLAPNEPGLAGFNIVLLDQAGAMGDSSGQLTYDMFGMPVSNSLANMIDPATGLDACPISPGSSDGLVGMIVTCPKYESDGTTLSPLAGHAIIANMYPGLYEVVASPGADRIARGEEWLQTNTLDGTKAIEAFIKAGEPAYFQEFGPGGYHVAVGFANAGVINARKPATCAGVGVSCTGNFYGLVTNTRMSRTPDQRVYSSGSYDSYSFAQCYVSLGTPDGDDFSFTKCNDDGTFEFTGIPTGNLRVTVFDQWNDLLVDGLSTPIKAAATGPGSSAANRLEIPVTQWRTNLYGRVFLDQNGDGVSQESEPGLPLVPYNIRYRDGSYAGFNNTDLAGYAGFNEVFPFLNWLVVDIDSARYKLSGVHVVYDAGGPVDGTTGAGTSTIADAYANTIESPTAHLPVDLRVPGARYCQGADCPLGDPGFDPGSGATYGTSPVAGSTGRVDPPWASTQGWAGLLGQNSYVEFAMKPFAPGENGGVRGHVVYTSTRPFDDPALLLQLSWEPGVANVKVNLYRQDTALDGTTSLKLVDTTTTTSWDDWSQGFRTDGKPNMSCPGQETTSPFYFTMQGGTNALNPGTPLPYDGRFKCYDGWSMLNQVQPAPYNGMYKFPSVTARNPLTGKPTATNCTACVPNTFAAATDFDRGAPMLPPGKYVVEVIVPPGYELVKEEDKNILLGDAFIAPATQQFAGFGNIFIMPDQAAVNAQYNPTNPIQATGNNGAVPRREGDTGSVEVFWPCVGATRIVPDLNSLYPAAGQQAPFAGASRPLCDRKEITLSDEMTALVKFYVFNSAHIAGHFTGTITNDFASEFDPFSPQFGEKFAVPNVPVALRDFAGKEIERVYADQWGIYNGMNFSTYTVNPPSPSGYIPQMMIACMNDPGPIPDPANPGLTITDPYYNPAYSNFCYEIPFMPGQTAYLDTPVIPTMAFAAGYNLPDCDYPDTTPAIKSVLGSALTGGSGPWVSAAGQQLTINALGDKLVLNHAYSGPMSTTAPFNKKYITRHYGFGSRCTAVGAAGCTAVSNVTIGGVTATISSWSDSQIVVTVPTGVPSCSANGVPLQRTGTGTGTFSQQCGELEITAGNGKKSVDTVTVTIGSPTPAYVTPSSATNVARFGNIQPNPLQTAIDNAAPGALIIVGPGTYKENLLMWKPVRLQGVGAESVIINADAHPAGKMDAWRRQLNCLFGMALNGRPITGTNPYDPGGVYSCPNAMRQHVDRIPFEAILGWDVTGNGNLAQMLQEPTLMGAYEGAGVTVLGKGVWMSAGTSVADQFGAAAAGGFPADYRYLNNSTANNANGDCRLPPGNTAFWREYYTTNFLCNPSRIDGISVINSSQGGGAIFAHAWNHNLAVGNNRVHGNHGTLTGGITIGTGEFADPFIAGGDVTPPFPVAGGTPNGLQLGYGFDRNVNVHHNSVTANASIGDALYSGTPSAAGGVTFCTGSDGYRLNNNWVCGNLSTGDAGGVSHSGFINDGRVDHNWIVFNQSQSATIPTHGGGLGVLGASPDRMLPSGVECGNTSDQDCPPGLPEGTGRNLLIDANLIMGNSAESGTGGGLRLQMVNGQDVIAFPLNYARWNDVTITNNIISNNVAGWDGGGVSMQDALRVRFINNTVMSNDTTASAGVLFNTLGAPLAAVPPPGCTPETDPTLPQDPSCINPVTTSTNQAAGLVTMQNTPNLTAALPATVICPLGYGYNDAALTNGACRQVSLPLLMNNVLWQNRAFHVEVSPLTGTGLQNQQKVVTLVPSLNQAATGVCVGTGTDNGAPGSGGSVNYWDVGVRGDTGPTNHASTFTLVPRYSILTSGDYAGSGNLVGSNPAVVAQYCNGARIPPENCAGVAGIDQARCKAYNAPPGHSEFTGLPVVFALNQTTVAATVDEGNNWINLGYGPLAVNNPSLYTTAGTALPMLGDYGLTGGSPAIGQITPTTVLGLLAYAAAPAVDFYGTARKTNNAVDIGAVEFVGAAVPAANLGGGPLTFGNVYVGAVSQPQTLTLANTGTGSVTGISFSFTGSYLRSTTSAGTCSTTAGFTLAQGASCTVNVVFAPTATGAAAGTMAVSASVTVTGSPVGLSGVGVAPPAKPTLTVLDNFNRTTGLGTNWQGLGLVGINANEATCTSAIACAIATAIPAGGTAYWNPTTFGAQQAAAMLITNNPPTNGATPVNGSSLVLKAGSGTTPANFARVRYSAGNVEVGTTTTLGVSYVTAGTIAQSFVTGDTLTAMVDATGLVTVWRTTAANVTTFIGAVQLPTTGANAFTTGAGRVGIQVPTNGRVDNFAGGTVP